MSKISVEYDPQNAENVFTRGDTITGRVVLEISKQSKVERLSVKAKGKALVQWTEHYGPYVHITYRAKKKYFSIKKHLLEDNGRVLNPGRHEFPFAFDIPDVELPSSFKGKHGKIKYTLKARASRSMRVDCKAKTAFTVVSKEKLFILGLMKPQQNSCEKSLAVFSSGQIAVNLYTQHMGYLQGEHLNVRAEIINNSSCTVTPRYYLYEKQSFYAGGKRRVYTKQILMEKGDPVHAKMQRNETKDLRIPQLLPASIFNCHILKLEYRVKVVLDVPMHRNLQVKLPIIVLEDTDGSKSKRMQDERLFWYVGVENPPSERNIVANVALNCFAAIFDYKLFDYHLYRWLFPCYEWIHDGAGKILKFQGRGPLAMLS